MLRRHTNNCISACPEVDVVKRIKKSVPEIPIIVIADQLDLDTFYNITQLGVFAILERPYSDHMLLSLCSSALRKSKLARLFNKSVDMLLYQLTDVEDYLNKLGKKDAVEKQRKDLSYLIQQRNIIISEGKTS